jgi:hypothetical protein
MAQQCKELRDENEQLKSIFTGIGRMIRDIEVPKTDRNGPNALLRVSSSVVNQQRYGAPTKGHFLANYPSQDVDFGQHSLSCVAEQRLVQGYAACDTEPPILSQPSLVRTSGTPLSQTHSQNSEVRPTSRATDISEELLAYEKDDAQLFAVIGNALRKAQQAQSLALTSTDPDRDEDIVIRAIAHGWHEVERCHSLDSAWYLLCYIDQNIFFCCGSVERLAILRLLRLKLQVSYFLLLILVASADGSLIGRSSFNPAATHTISSSLYVSKVDISTANCLFLCNIFSRPLQTFVEHATIIDYIVW